MTTLIELADTDGSRIYVNPQHVVLIQEIKNKTPYRTRVVLSHGLDSIHTSEAAREVARKLGFTT